MAIELNTPDLIKYNEAVEFNARRQNNFMFNNGGDAMALIVFRSIFRTATQKIQIVAQDLNNPVTNDAEYITALEFFLMKPESKLEILVSNYSPNNNILFEMLKKYPSKVVFKVIEGGRTFKDTQGRVIHFCIADGHMYRLEYNTNERKAECNFNDTKEYSLLNTLFYSVFNNNTYSCVQAL